MSLFQYWHSQTSKNRTIRGLNYFRLAWVILSILPAIALLNLLVQNNVNVPFADQWAVTYTVIKSATQGIGWQDLFAQHNESRKVFPRLIYVALAHLTRYNVNYEILVAYVITGVTSMLLLCLSYRTLKGTWKTHFLLLLLVNLLLFTPAQYEAWMIGLSNVVFISIGCLVASIFVAYTQFQRWLKYVICISLAIISTFSFANGMLIWVLTLPVLLIVNCSDSLGKSLYRDRWYIFAWLGAFGISLVTYFYQYQKPASHPSLTQAWGEPGKAISYFLAFLGNPFAWGTQLHNPLFAAWIGAILLTVFVLLIGYLLWQERSLWQQAIGWVMLGCYTILSAAITTAGRVGFGVDQALASRYVTFALYLPIAIIYLFAIVRQHAIRHSLTAVSDNTSPTSTHLGNSVLRSPSLVSPTPQVHPRFLHRINPLVTSVLTLFLLFHGLTSFYATEQMGIWRQERRQMKTCLTLIQVGVDTTCLKQLSWGTPDELKSVANSLNSLGWMDPPLIQPNSLQMVVGQPLEASGYGVLDQLTIFKPQGKPTQCSLQGWAVLPDRKRLPDAVLVTYDTPTQASSLFRVFPVKERRPDVANSLRVPAYRHAGWSGTFQLNDIPATGWSPQGSAQITVWSFDLEQQKAVAIARQTINQNL